MTKRLQVLLDDDELQGIQELAKRRRQTTAAFVREALRAARTAAEYPTIEHKLRAIREAAQYTFPAGDIGAIRAEIEAGYLGDTPAPESLPAPDGLPAPKGRPAPQP